MSHFALLFRSSLLEFKKLESITIAAVLTALSVVLGLFQINFGEFLRIGFNFIPLGMIGLLFGPVMGGVCAAVSDVLTLFVVPTGGWIWGLTLNAFLGGIIYGCCFYQRKLSAWRTGLAMAIVGVCLNMFLWLL